MFDRHILDLSVPVFPGGQLRSVGVSCVPDLEFYE